jgi:dihydropteroate synthase
MQESVTSREPLIMGVLNCTPDSFYDGGAYPTATAAVERARRMVEKGADIVDVGGESTRPGSEPVDAAEQIRRTVPVIAQIRRFWRGSISIDTTRASVAREALDAGADWINDISALRDDPAMASVAAEADSHVVLMHMQGSSRTMQDAPSYVDVVDEVAQFLKERADWAGSQGIKPEHLVIDPGIGFGKDLSHNLAILRSIPRFASLGYPVLIGASRKSFIGRITGDDVEDRLEGSLAAAIWSALHGADILRVHDVRSTRRVLDVVRALAEPRLQAAETT